MSTKKTVSQSQILMMHDATAQDRDFLIEMSRYASIIEDRPLPAADSADVLSQLPSGGGLAIIASNSDGKSVGAIWVLHSNPPLLMNTAGSSVPEIIISVDQNHRGQGIGGALIDEFMLRAQGRYLEVCLNVHVRNPARKLYKRKGFIEKGKGRGELGMLMVKTID